VILKNLILHKVAPYAREKFEKKIEFPVKPGRQVDPDRALQGVDRDGVSIHGRVDNIWIDHCTLSLCGDECIGMANISGPGQAKFTVSWCDFSNQYYVALIGQTREDYVDDKRIRLTFHHNRIRGAARRSPRVNRATADIYNNFYEGWVDWAVAANANSKVLIEGNIFQPRVGASRMAVNVGTTDQIEGFVRTENNSLLYGTKTVSNEAGKVSVPTYARSVETPDDRLQQRIRTESGWQNLNVDFSKLEDSN
jgi:pectate lyase